MRQVHGARHFQYLPQTYLLPSEYKEFQEEFVKDRTIPWIVKPCTSSCGRGIFVPTSLSEIPQDEHLLVSRYIANPLLIDGYKFDIRLYVAVTSFDPLRIYLYKDGLVRFATTKFSNHPKARSNPFIHLTNYSINKHSTNYVQNEDEEVDNCGSKWSLLALWDYLAERGVDTNALQLEIQDIILKSLISVETYVVQAMNMFVSHRSNCFELFGFDILLDDTYKPWLMEVNLSPSLSCDTPLDLKVKGHMISDLFSMLCLNQFDRKKMREKKKRRQLGGISGENKLKYWNNAPLAANKPSRMRPFDPSKPLELCPEERRVVRQTLAESKRRGTFVRIFPTRRSIEYERFFETPRRLNQILYDCLFRYPLSTTLSATGSTADSASCGPPVQHPPRTAQPGLRPVTSQTTTHRRSSLQSAPSMLTSPGAFGLEAGTGVTDCDLRRRSGAPHDGVPSRTEPTLAPSSQHPPAGSSSAQGYARYTDSDSGGSSDSGPEGKLLSKLQTRRANRGLAGEKIRAGPEVRVPGGRGAGVVAEPSAADLTDDAVINILNNGPSQPQGPSHPSLPPRRGLKSRAGGAAADATEELVVDIPLSLSLSQTDDVQNPVTTHHHDADTIVQGRMRPRPGAPGPHSQCNGQAPSISEPARWKPNTKLKRHSRASSVSSGWETATDSETDTTGVSRRLQQSLGAHRETVGLRQTPQSDHTVTAHAHHARDSHLREHTHRHSHSNSHHSQSSHASRQPCEPSTASSRVHTYPHPHPHPLPNHAPPRPSKHTVSQASSAPATTLHDSLHQGAQGTAEGSVPTTAAMLLKPGSRRRLSIPPLQLPSLEDSAQQAPSTQAWASDATAGSTNIPGPARPSGAGVCGADTSSSTSAQAGVPRKPTVRVRSADMVMSRRRQEKTVVTAIRTRSAGPTRSQERDASLRAAYG
eukprot:Rmarinus@m.3012